MSKNIKPQSSDIFSPQHYYSVPRDRLSINKLLRELYHLNSLVFSTVDFYSHYPLNFLKIHDCNDTHANELFQNQIKQLDLYHTISKIIQEYWLLGECYIYAELNEVNKLWERLIIQNPEYIVVNQSTVGDQSLSLRPDQKLRTTILASRTNDSKKEEIKQLDQTIIQHVLNGENIPLSNFNITSFIRKSNPYDVRGNSFFMPVLKELHLLKLIDDNADVENPNFQYICDNIKSSICHPSIINHIDNSHMRDLVRQKLYLLIDQQIIPWLQDKIFSPIAKLNNLYEMKNDVKTLIVPNITFDIKNLFNNI